MPNVRLFVENYTFSEAHLEAVYAMAHASIAGADRIHTCLESSIV